jgi:hypothetical protein
MAPPRESNEKVASVSARRQTGIIAHRIRRFTP